MLRAVAVIWTLAILASGCNGKVRPPFAGLDDELPGQSDADAPFSPLPSSGDGPCETVVELTVLKPNFYFIVDTSGSMAERMPGSSVSRHRAAIEAIEQMLSQMQNSVNFGAAVFPSSFNGASCEAGNEVFKLTEGRKDSPSRTPLESLIATLSGFVPEGGSPVSPTLHELSSKLRSFKGETHVVLLSDGAPNCNLDETCSAGECILNLEGAVFDDGSACDEDRNCCAAEWFPHMCLDSDPTVKELSRLADAGVETYVVGLPGGAAYSDLLNRMAEAGGTARSTLPQVSPIVARDAGATLDGGIVSADASKASDDASTGATVDAPEAGPGGDSALYYQVTDAKSLGAALALVRQEALVGCTLDLDFAPTSPEVLQVMAGGEQLGDEDWRLVPPQQVELLGTTCTAWKAGTLPEVKVAQSCRGNVR